MAVLIQTEVNALPRSCPGGTSSSLRFRNCPHSVVVHFLLLVLRYIWNDVLVPWIRLHQFSEPIARCCLGVFVSSVDSCVYSLLITTAEGQAGDEIELLWKWIPASGCSLARRSSSIHVFLLRRSEFETSLSTISCEKRRKYLSHSAAAVPGLETLYRVKGNGNVSHCTGTGALDY